MGNFNRYPQKNIDRKTTLASGSTNPLFVLIHCREKVIDKNIRLIKLYRLITLPNDVCEHVRPSPVKGSVHEQL